MKIIEAMKRVKSNKEKIHDLQMKIAQHSAHLSYETSVYGNLTRNRIEEWTQSCHDLIQDNVQLLTAISRTNLATTAQILLGGKSVTKNLAEWIWRRREYAELDMKTWANMTDRGLKESNHPTSTGEPLKVTVIRHYDPVLRDTHMAMYKGEPHEIDATLEVVNAVTDLIE